MNFVLFCLGDEDEEQESFFPYISATTQNKADDYIAEDDQEGDARPIKYNKQTSRKLVVFISFSLQIFCY